jgi:quercetin dioxygenase-like cupin family protein
MSDLTVRRFETSEWSEEETKGDNTAEQLERARAGGYRRKRLLAGEGDVFLTHVEMGPGFVVEPHSHNAREVIHVLAGSLTPQGGGDELTTGDSIVIPAGHVYGFRCGKNGVKFLIFRPTQAGIDHVA